MPVTCLNQNNKNEKKDKLELRRYLLFYFVLPLPQETWMDLIQNSVILSEWKKPEHT